MLIQETVKIESEVPTSPSEGLLSLFDGNRLEFETDQECDFRDFASVEEVQTNVGLLRGSLESENSVRMTKNGLRRVTLWFRELYVVV